MTKCWKVVQAAAVARYDERPLTNVPLFIANIHQRTYLRQALRRAVGKRLGRDKG